MGGNDQWINILDGVNLIQRKRGATAHAMTLPLLLDRTGEKMGKTSTGETIWLAGGGEPSTSPFDFYQYWVNCPDEDTERNFRLFTFLPMEEIDAILAGHPREAQHRLAYEVTKIVHGEEIARQLQVDSLRAFKGTGLPSEVPTVVLSAAEAQAGVPLITLLTQVGVKSRSEARRLIEQGGVLVNGERLGQGDMQYQVGLKDFRDFDGEKAAVIRFGKGKAAKVLLR
jgi:tyrosyl-tRNA synthetase